MEKTVDIVGRLRWLGFPLGCVMFLLVRGSFGLIPAATLGAAAAAGFWGLMISERSRLIGATIAGEIRKAITETADVESLIEIKRLRSGIIARIYLINAREQALMIQRAVTRRMEQCSFKQYLWIMQLTDIPGKSALRETQKMLNEQLIEELMRSRKNDKE